MMHIPSLKHVTKNLPIKTIGAPPELYMPLNAYKGIMQPLVSTGQAVKKYQLIAKSDGMFAATLHAPVSGTVLGIEAINGQPHIKISNDLLETEAHLPPVDADALTMEQIISLLKEYGIEGSGGARFPTHLKYSPAQKIHTLIINAAECEPYLSADYALLKNETPVLLKAIAVLQKVLKAQKIVIAIERQHKALLSVINRYSSSSNLPLSIKWLPNQYPQGGELQLIKSVTGKELPKGTVPAQHGIVVNNIGTLWAVYNAVYHNRPYTERVITFSGPNATLKGNYLVKIGTPVSFITEQLGSPLQNGQTVVMGGPMMGKATNNANTPVNKGTGGILLLPVVQPGQYNCIQCGYCIQLY